MDTSATATGFLLCVCSTLSQTVAHACFTPTSDSIATIDSLFNLQACVQCPLGYLFASSGSHAFVLMGSPSCIGLSPIFPNVVLLGIYLLLLAHMPLSSRGVPPASVLVPYFLMWSPGSLHVLPAHWAPHSFAHAVAALLTNSDYEGSHSAVSTLFCSGFVR
jgi:hypothetical protein